MSIQWFPGHMHKARVQMQEALGQVDLFIELLDARIPYSSENPMLASIRRQKPCLKVLSKSDLADPGRLVVLCAAEVPCGRYAADALGQAGVDVEPVSLEENVKAVVSKVALGEADAGIAYATDVAAAGGDVDGVPIGEEVTVVAEYPLAVTVEADAERAQDFVDFVVGDRGRTILAEHGFGVP